MLATIATNFSGSFNLSEEEAVGLGAILLGMAGTIVVTELVLFVLRVIAYWRLFEKAGEPGWKSIIPIYRRFVLYKFTWKTPMFWVEFVLTIVVIVLAQMINGDNGNIVLALITLALCVVLIVVGVTEDIKMAKSYGKGTAFAIGLIFLSPIFELILGLGDSKYVGPEGIPTQA